MRSYKSVYHSIFMPQCLPPGNLDHRTTGGILHRPHVVVVMVKTQALANNKYTVQSMQRRQILFKYLPGTFDKKIDNLFVNKCSFAASQTEETRMKEFLHDSEEEDLKNTVTFTTSLPGTRVRRRISRIPLHLPPHYQVIE